MADAAPQQSPGGKEPRGQGPSAGQPGSSEPSDSDADKGKGPSRQSQQAGQQQAGQQGNRQLVPGNNHNGTPTYVPTGPTFMETYGGMVKAVIAAVIVIAVLVLVYVFVVNRPVTVTTTTTVQPAFSISSCQAISSPGTYYLSGNIDIGSINGSCIDIRSGGVDLTGNGHSIETSVQSGAGTSTSYGVRIDSQSNVTVSDMTLARFSYGIYLDGSDKNRISNVTVINSTVSGIYLEDSSHNVIDGDSITGTTGQEGGINISYGGNNTVSRTTVEYGSYYGISLSGSTGNNISRSSVLGNHIDLACSGTSSLKAFNTQSDSTCYVNQLCNFAYCSQSNTQYQVSSTPLGTQVDSCGSIDAAGTYSLSQDLNFTDYMNVSIPSSHSVPCIYVDASNVYLNCMGHSITDAPYGIMYAPAAYNVTVSGCRLQDDVYGMYLNGSIKFSIVSVTASGNRYGIYIFDSTDGSVANTTAEGNSYGYYVNGTTYATLDGFHASGNRYGIAIDNSSDVYLSGGTTMSNSNVDLYCSPDTYNSTLFSVAGTSCQSSDCNWAEQECPIRYLPSLSAYPITGCTTITTPGHYRLENYVQTSGTCFNIDANDVTFDCNNQSVVSLTNAGSAFSISGTTNDTVYGCIISGFTNGVKVQDTDSLTFSSSVLRLGVDGFNVSNSTGMRLANDTVKGFTERGFQLQGVNGSSILGDTSYSSLPGYGYALTGSFHNSLINDTANSTQYGFYFNNSRFNTVYGNRVNSGQGYDYYCSPNSGGVLDQYGRVNTGATEQNCKWLSENSTAYLSQLCTLITSPDTITLSQDIDYPYGGTCFSVYSQGNQSASGTTINCAGHTVFATDGGSFMSATNTSTLTLENCVLIGFTNSVVVVSDKGVVTGISIINNTIVNSGNASVIVDGAEDSQVLSNYIQNSTTGIYLSEFNGSTVRNNYIQQAVAGIVLNYSESTSLVNNTANDSSFGIKLHDSIESSLMDNIIRNSLNGLFCSGSSGPGTSGNTDLGGNVCSNSAQCSWITSAGCK